MIFAFAGGSGHLEPLVSIAYAARHAGHEVAFSGRPAAAVRVEALGFPMFVTGPPGPEAPVARTPLLELSAEREDAVLRDGFAGRIARERVEGLAGVFADWRPDVVVAGELDFGAAIAAERTGLPCATVLISATERFVRDEVVAEPLAALRTEHGLPAGASRPAIVLSPFPRRLRPLPPDAHAFRAAPAQRAPHDATTIYATLGTIFNRESGDLFERILAGLRDLPADVIATTGSDLDPADLRPQPANVRVERHLPQGDVLPRCRAVVSHAGSGTVLGALAHGLPSVLLPMGADQPQNAARCEELGVARVLHAPTTTPEAIRDAVADVLADPRYRAAAERVADEIAALPDAAHAADRVARLAPRDLP